MKIFAICFAKVIGWLLKKGNRGGSFPGKVALKIYPDILKCLSYQGKVIIVTGTNGKTSCANMIASSLKEANKQVINNQKGDNLKYGITSTLVMNSSFKGIISSDMIVLEVDELSMPYVMEHVRADFVVITNFFRDQLDRSKEMEQLIQTVESSLSSFKKDLILNGNDPNVVRFAYSLKQAIPHFYGVDHETENGCNEVHEGTFCPLCGNHLIYDSRQYSHIGIFHCEHCTFETPDHQHTAYQIKNRIFYYLRDQYEAPVDALYMIYNCMSVLTLFDVLGISKQHVKRAFKNFIMPEGRNEHFSYGKHEIILNLVKNPTGTNEVLKQIKKDVQDKVIVFLLNDHEQDGTDISWIYDSDFEYLFQDCVKSIFCCGTRAHEAALRMKYGGFKGELYVETDLEVICKKAMQYDKTIYVLSTYTGLFTMRAMIKKVIL